MSSDPINDKTDTTASMPSPVRSVWWRQKLLVLSLLLAVLCGLACLQLWLKLSTMQEQLARQSADAEQLSVQANSMAKHAEQLTQETAAR
ncbi:MAG: hypothetical protein EBR18_08515, partial [Betaproteobacteria bacterium]|nr:hypothetical protein [Betaproteobacteria bacterium]